MRTSLVRLYPHGWRDRYGDEFEAVLEQQPASFGLLIDVLLGAIDAHRTARAPKRRGWWIDRIPGLLMVLGALTWVVAFAFRSGGFGQDVVNISSIFVPIGKVAVGLSVLAMPTWWVGGSRLQRLGNVVMGIVLVVGASAIRAVHLSQLLAPGLVDYTWALADSLFVQAICVAQLLWAALMLACSPIHKAPLLLMAATSLVLLNVDIGVIDPTYGNELLFEAIAVSWLGVGMSLLWQGRRTARMPPLNSVA